MVPLMLFLIALASCLAVFFQLEELCEVPVGSNSAKKWTGISQDLFLHSSGSLRQALSQNANFFSTGRGHVSLSFSCLPPLTRPWYL